MHQRRDLSLVNKYYTSSYGKDSFTAGVKAPQDTCLLLERRGYKRIGFYEETKRGIKAISKICRALSWLFLFFSIRPDSLVVMQFPYNITNQANFFIPIIKRYKKTKFLFVLHDIDSARDYNNDTNEKTESAILNADYLICHNDSMRELLINKGIPENRLFVLKMFDYLTEHSGSIKNNSGGIIIAGNLGESKSPYLYKLLKMKRDYTINLYGPFYKENSEYYNSVYHGVFKPEELPNVLEGAFGLVWDGDSTDTCSGSTGEYLKYNNPHKASLYIASGIPLIVWDQSAISTYVKKQGVGITISSLSQINDIMGNMDEKSYQNLRNNTIEESKKVTSGYYFNHVMNEIELIISES